jgi:hypothetical protein
MRSKNAPSQKTAGSPRLQRKILMATSIMLKEMEPRKKDAIFNFLKGMMELNEEEERLFEERMAELKGILEMEETNQWNGLKKRNPEV